MITEVNAGRGKHSIDEKVSKIVLRAETEGDKHWLARLFRALEAVGPWERRLRGVDVPELRIVEQRTATE